MNPRRIPQLAFVTVLLLTCVARAADETTSVSGLVVSPSGDAVADAEVIVITPDKSAYPNLPLKERDEWRRGAATTRTDASGHFTVKLPKDAGLLSIHHPKSGYAEVKTASLAENAKVKLEPWCRIEGVFKIGPKPAPIGSKVSLGAFGWGATACRVHYMYDTKTIDAEGHYVLDRVPAGVNQIRVRASKTASILEIYTGAQPDKPTKFDIGGAGRPVIGKVVMSGDWDLKNLNKKNGSYTTSYFRRDVPWPNDKVPRDIQGDQEREDAVRNWRKTPEAIEAHKEEYRCNIAFQPDGSFRLDDVPPGTYKLEFHFDHYSVDRNKDPGVDLKVDVMVPADSPAVPTDQPLDLGELKIGEAKGL